MSNFINSLNTKDATTENGALTHSTSNSRVLDLFFRGGAMRAADEQDIVKTFLMALDEDPDLAMKTLFWIRDIRGGAGERRVFRTIMRNLAENSPRLVDINLNNISEFGRWDDLIDLFLYDKTKTYLKNIIISYIRGEILQNKNGLLAKWLPRKGVDAAKIRHALGWSPKFYRKTIVSLTNVVETNMCSNEWHSIEYKKVPSLAMTRYRKAFYRHDNDRFETFNEKVISGKEKINVGAIYPYDILKEIYSYGSFRKPINKSNIIAQWNNLPNFLGNSNDFRILPICDVSGSMESNIGSNNLTALLVCVSLGIYIAERNEGPFKDYFITFSEDPKLQKLVGNDVVEKAINLSNADWGMSTNIQATYDMILNKSIENNVKDNEMPTHLLILSDMEFDRCSNKKDRTIMEDIRKKYKKSGYTMPNIIFWNLMSRQSNIPVKMNEDGVALVSGFSPSILKSLLNGSLNPVQVMLDTINTERYSVVRF